MLESEKFAVAPLNTQLTASPRRVPVTLQPVIEAMAVPSKTLSAAVKSTVRPFGVMLAVVVAVVLKV